ncbi:MAG: CvpA family protein [Planctomycetota bacterium]
MQAYDLIMLIVLSMATIFGAIKGFAWQVASIASVIVSYLVAYNFRYDVAEMIQQPHPWNLFLAMLILYVGTSFAIWVGFRIFSSMIDRVRLKEFDRHLGAGFGFAKGLVYCLLITMFAMSLLGQNQQRAICQSKSGYFIASALDRGVGILPKEVHDVVGPYLAELDNKLKDGQSGAPGETVDWDNSGLGDRIGNVLADQIPSLPEGVTGVLGGMQDSLQNMPSGSNFAPIGSTPGQPADGSQAPQRFAAQPGNSTYSQPANPSAYPNANPPAYPPAGASPARFGNGNPPASFSNPSGTPASGNSGGNSGVFPGGNSGFGGNRNPGPNTGNPLRPN